MACLLGAALLSTGCASEGDQARRLRPRPSGTGPEAEADEALVDSTLLTVDDFPDSWRALPGPAVETRLSAEAEADLARCVGTEGAVFDSDLPHAYSPLFASPTGDTVIAQVALAPDDSGPRRTIELLRRAEAPGCWAEVIQSGLIPPGPAEGAPADFEYGTLSAVALPYADFGDTTVAWRTSIPVSAGGGGMNLYLDTVVVRVDRALVTLSFQSQVSPYDRDQSEGVTLILVERVTEAVADSS